MRGTLSEPRVQLSSDSCVNGRLPPRTERHPIQTTAEVTTKLSFIYLCLLLFHSPTLTLGTSSISFSLQEELLDEGLERT